MNDEYFDFVLCLEYVFVQCLTPIKLTVLGNSIVKRVHNKLIKSSELRNGIKHLMNERVDDDVMIDLVSHLVKTYCRMRGKDFCHQLMTTDFSNLGKGIRLTLAVLLDKK